MQTFKCHKVVEAGKIAAVVPRDADRLAYINIDGEGTIFVADDYLKRHRPEVGGYYVKYVDGYESYSPAKAFEEGYTPVTRATDEELAALSGEPILRYFTFAHLPEHLQGISRPFAELAYLLMKGDRSAERSAGLRKLLEAKDCAVRNALASVEPKA
jgi:hypothetical protein